MKTLAAIPCHDEGLAIGSVVLKARKYVDCVLVVDDGSTDDTVEVSEEAGAAVVSHGVNKGYGAAIRSCFNYVKENNFDVMVILDGDGQHDPSYIPEFINALRTNGADVVIGSRFLDKNNNNTIPKWRVAGMKVLDVFTRAAGDIKITDSQSGYRTYSRRAIEKIKIINPDMGAGSEILTQVKDCNLKLVEIPIKVRYDIDSTSSKNSVSHGFGVLGSIIRVIAEKRPLLYIGVPGLVFLLIGFFFGLQLLRQYNQSGYFSMPFTMLAGFFIIVGTLAVFIGLVLNVISRLVTK
ncbi:MAG: glycosyltransferase family 2 protein [Halobacteriota archaeon]